jgi:putative transposase
MESSSPLPSVVGSKHHTGSGSVRYCNKWTPKAVKRLADDWERLVTFYQFPREHWPHLRTSNVVESPFATVRLRTTAAKRFKKVENATALIWKLLQVAESTFRRLKGAELLSAVYAGAQYVDGVKRSPSRQQQIAA